jgi:hypothetical protein
MPPGIAPIPMRSIQMNKVTVYFKGKQIVMFHSAASSELANFLIAVDLAADHLGFVPKHADITINVR